MKKIILNVAYKTKNYKKHFAVIDSEDFERVSKYNWYVIKKSNTMYAGAWINGKTIYLHTFIAGFSRTDHIDGNGLNCQRSNLRKATQRQNCMNSASRKNSTSKFKGVSWSEERNKWVAQISNNCQKIGLGRFTSEIEAAKKYNKAALEFQGEFAKLNII